MSSCAIQRRMATAVVSSRPLSGMVAAGRYSRRSRHPEFLHHGNAPQGDSHPDHPPNSRGLAHYAKGEASTAEQQERQHEKKTMHSLEQPSHVPKQQGHLQTRRLQQQTTRPTTTQAQQSSTAGVGAAVLSHETSLNDSYSVLASQKVFHKTVEDWAQTSFCPETRLQTAVERFRDRFFVDELPCRTRKSVAEAAAAGKGYITAGDISRVFETISDENSLLTEDEAHAIIHAAWGIQESGNTEKREVGGQGGIREATTPGSGDSGTRASSSASRETSPNAGAAAVAGAKISTEEFIRVLQPKNPSKTK
ncbi:unnamed protein product [Scytosiphon promiscuus]